MCIIFPYFYFSKTPPYEAFYVFNQPDFCENYKSYFRTFVFPAHM